MIMSETDRLQELLLGMDVPASRRSDLNWLARNLGVRNRGHSNFGEAEKLIKILRKREEVK